MDTSELPQFTIASVEETADGWLLHGVFNHLDTVQEGGGWLFVPWTGAAWEGHDTYGEALVALERETRQGRITTRTRPPDGITTFSWLYDYWNPWQIAMITDPDRPWEQIQFQASDAFARRLPNGWRELKQADDEALSKADMVRIPGGWDHEHCEICWTHIDSGNTGYYDGQFYWLCAVCFERYARPHNISFVRNE